MKRLSDPDLTANEILPSQHQHQHRERPTHGTAAFTPLHLHAYASASTNRIISGLHLLFLKTLFPRAMLRQHLQAQLSRAADDDKRTAPGPAGHFLTEPWRQAIIRTFAQPQSHLSAASPLDGCLTGRHTSRMDHSCIALSGRQATQVHHPSSTQVLGRHYEEAFGRPSSLPLPAQAARDILTTFRHGAASRQEICLQIRPGLGIQAPLRQYREHHGEVFGTNADVSAASEPLEQPLSTLSCRTRSASNPGDKQLPLCCYYYVIG